MQKASPLPLLIRKREVSPPPPRPLAQHPAIPRMLSSKAPQRLDIGARGGIVRVAISSSWIAALSEDGVLAMFNHRGVLACYGNAVGEEIRGFELIAERLYTIALSAVDGYASLRCRVTELGGGGPRLGATRALFEGEQLSSGFSFAEFNARERVALTYAHVTERAAPQTYKIWSLPPSSGGAALLFAVRDRKLANVSVGEGMLLLVHKVNAVAQILPLKVVDLATGKSIRSFRCDIPTKSGGILFGPTLGASHIWLRQCRGPLRIIDVRSGRERRVATHASYRPTALTSLGAARVVLTVSAASGGAHLWTLPLHGANAVKRRRLRGPPTAADAVGRATTLTLHVAPSQDVAIALVEIPSEQRREIRVTRLKVEGGSRDCVATFAVPIDALSVAWCERRARLAVGLRSGRVLVWE